MRSFFRYVEMAIGCFIFAAAINLFFVPIHLLAGGVSGISMIVYYLTGFPIGVQTFIYNIPLFFLAYKFLSRTYLLDAVVGTVLSSIFIDLTSSWSSYNLVSDSLLAAIFGGVLHGIGYGILFRAEGSTGGIDIIAAIVKKYYSLDMGGVSFVINCLIISVSAMFFGIMPAMYTLVALFMTASVIDKVVAGYDHQRVLLIISSQPEVIARAIMLEGAQGVTYIDGEGAYTNSDKRILLVATRLTKVARLKNIASSYDKNAYMVVLQAV